MRPGWEHKLLKDICSVFGRIGFRGYTKADFVSSPDDGAITLSPSNIIGGELSCDKCSYVSWEKYYQSPEIMIFPGDILLVKTASIGKCALVRFLPHEATINPQFVVLKEIKANHQYLTYFLQSPIAQKKFQEFAIGAAVPTFSQKKLEGLVVPIPSLPEQQRIVDILDQEFAKIDALKANAEKSLQAAKDLFQATLKKELEPKVGWDRKTMNDICSIYGRIGFRGYTKADLVSSPKDGAITLSPSNIIDGELQFDKCSYITWEKYEQSPEIKVFDGDIILVKTASIGKCALVKNLPHKATLNPQFVVLKEIVLDHSFLTYFLQSPVAQEKFKEFAIGAAVPTFSQKKLGMMQVPVPSNEEQHSIASKLDTLKAKSKALQENYQKTISLCDNLKQSLLRKAFNGEL